MFVYSKRTFKDWTLMPFYVTSWHKILGLIAGINAVTNK